ncbi:MAG: glycosyltransferase family 4 protein [Candidatus Binatus sp.]|jgi:glycosyltransferase involved in cell wall biosynthesis
MGVVGAVDKRPLTVAFLSPEWPPDNAANGIVPYVANVTAGLRRLGHNVCILAGHSESANSEPDVFLFESQERSALARIRDAVAFRINRSAAERQRFSNALVRATQRAIAERGVQLLEMEESFGWLQLVKAQLPIPVVVRLHGPHFANGAALGVPADASFHQRVLEEGIGVAQADGVSAPSRDVLERTREYYKLPLTGAALIPAPTPAVPADKRWSLTECDRSRLLFVGRFDRHKGGDVVIDAFSRVARRFPEVRLWLAGPDKGGFTDEQGRNWTPPAYIAERAPDLAARIDCLGWQTISALAELRRKAFATIVASRYENFPMAVLEAMRYGCPLAATRAGGIVEIIEDGVNGVLAQPGDPDDLAAAIIRLLEAPEFAANLGRRAAEDVVRRYHPDVVARETAAFHQTVIDSWNSRDSRTR